MKKLSGFPIWMLFAFTCFFNWAAVLMAGIISGNKKWILYGGLYALPLVLVFIVAANDEDTRIRRDVKEKIMQNSHRFTAAEKIDYATAILAAKSIELNQQKMDSIDLQISNENRASSNRQKKVLKSQIKKYKAEISANIKGIHPDQRDWFENFALTLWMLSSLAAFVHAWIIKPKYWAILQEKEQGKRAKYAHNQRFALNNPQQNKLHYKLLAEAQQARKEILNKLETSEDIDTYLTSDIKRMTENFMKQIKLLVEKDKKLSLQIKPSDLKRTELELAKLNKKLELATDARLVSEIQNAINSKQKLADSYKEMGITHDTIKLRLETAVSSLKQVKFDLIKLEGVFNDEQKKQFFTDFEDKANELSDYVDAVKESYQ